jgi:hypothetical protein
MKSHALTISGIGSYYTLSMCLAAIPRSAPILSGDFQMIRSLLAVSLAALVLLNVGCDAKDAAKDMAGKAGDAAKGAVSDAAGGAGDMLGKASEALTGVEGGAEMLAQVKDMFGKLTTTLGDVKDADSATAAVPELSKLTDGLGGMTDMFGKMPDAAKGAVSGVFKSSIEQLKPILDKVMAIPGVEAILKPAIDALMSKLAAFTA